MSDIKTYSKRIESQKNDLNQNEAKKSLKEKELDKLKNEYSVLTSECKEKFDCEPKDLKNKILSLETEIDAALEKAETLLEELSEE